MKQVLVVNKVISVHCVHCAQSVHSVHLSGIESTLEENCEHVYAIDSRIIIKLEQYIYLLKIKMLKMGKLCKASLKYIKYWSHFFQNNLLSFKDGVTEFFFKVSYF